MISIVMDAEFYPDVWFSIKDLRPGMNEILVNLVRYVEVIFGSAIRDIITLSKSWRNCSFNKRVGVLLKDHCSLILRGRGS